MRNQSNNPDKKNSMISITTALCEQPLLQSVVEELAHRRIDIGFGRQRVPAGLKAIETSSIEAYVSGDMSITSESDLLDMAFTTCFLFTCIKAKGGEYKLSWSVSLS
jgi:hypothetical protein